jgi:membrane dipeptidase
MKTTAAAPPLDDSALELHRRAIVIDMHADTVQRVLDQGIDLQAGASGLHLDLPKMCAGGLDAQFFSIWPDPRKYWGCEAQARALALIAALDAQVERHPCELEQATTASDIRRLASQGKIAALMGIEGGHAINDDLDVLRDFFARGACYLTLTHSRSTAWAGSSGDTAGAGRGLSAFGREVVREMNRLGMLVDVSHVSDRTFWDVLAVASKPVIASHSAARSLAAHPRNLSDEMIRAVAAGGGVVCVVFYPVFLDDEFASAARAVTEALAPQLSHLDLSPDPVAAGYEKDRLLGEALQTHVTPLPLARLVDHIDHLTQLVGADHVGLGSDFDGIAATPAGLETVAQLPALTVELARRGYHEREIEKMLGLNILRVMEAQKPMAGGQ